MTDNTSYYPPLSQEDINNEINKAQYPENARYVLNDGFDGLDRPCVVSLGVSNNLDNIYNVMKTRGFNIAREGDPESDDQNKFLLSKDGLRFPVLSPKDAVKAVTDVVDTIGKENILGYALPQVSDNYCKYVSDKQNNVLDVEVVVEKDPQIKALLAEKQLSADEFINQQLSQAKQLKGTDVVHWSADNLAKEANLLYRGGTIGDAPYMIAAKEGNRACCYGTPYMDWANLFAQGASKGHCYQYKNKIDNREYGFIYQYKGKPDQKFYCDAGVQLGRKGTANSAEKDEKSTSEVETTMYPYQNPVTGVYLSIRGLQPVCITDKKGEFISQEWADFVKLHSPYMMFENDKEQKRYENERDALIANNTVPYRLNTQNSTLDLSNEKQDLVGFNLTDYDNVVISNDVERINGIKIKPRKCYDFTRFEKLTSLSNMSFKNGEEVKMPKSIKALRNIEFPESATLDLSVYPNLQCLENIDLSKYKHVELPSNIKSLKNVKLPQDDVLDLSKYSQLETLTHMDLGVYKEVKLPSSIEELNYVQGPRNKMDLNNGTDMFVENCDFSKTSYVCAQRRMLNFSTSNTCSEKTIFDFSQCDNLIIREVNFSEAKMIKLSKDIFDMEGAILPKVVDINACKNIPDFKHACCDNVETIVEDNPWRRLKGKLSGKFPKKTTIKKASALKDYDYKEDEKDIRKSNKQKIDKILKNLHSRNHPTNNIPHIRTNQNNNPNANGDQTTNKAPNIKASPNNIYNPKGLSR